MKGLRPIRTVEDLQQYLSHCPANAQVTLVPEEGTGFAIGGVLQFAPVKAGEPDQVWILIDDCHEDLDDLDESVAMEWSGGPPDDDDIPFDDAPPEEKEDVVQIRGNMRSA